MSKTKTKEITTAYWNIRKHHMLPIEISKLPQANCLGAEIDETCNWFREQCRFFSWRKIRGGEKSPVLMSKLENVCRPRTELSAKQNNRRVCSDFFFHFRDPKAPFISQTGAVS